MRDVDPLAEARGKLIIAICQRFSHIHAEEWMQDYTEGVYGTMSNLIQSYLIGLMNALAFIRRMLLRNFKTTFLRASAGGQSHAGREM